MREETKIKMLDIRFNAVKQEQLLEEVFRNIEEKKMSSIMFVNVDVAIKAEKDELLKQALNESEMVLADGMPIIWISKLFKTPLPEKISGSDFVPELCRMAAQKGKKLFLAGGGEGVAERAAENLLMKYPGIQISGWYSPPYGFENQPEEIEKMNAAIHSAGPDIVIVCLGCPKQERYVYENRDKYKAGISICAGATIDFLAGNVKRCPAWMSRYGLEWFFRFLQEPKRLFKRYFIDDIQILRMVLKYRPGKSQ